MKRSRGDPPTVNPGQKDERLAAAVLGSTARFPAVFLRRWQGQRVEEEGAVAARSRSRLPSHPDGSDRGVIVVVHKIHSGVRDLSANGSIMERVKDLLEGLKEVRIKLMRRCANKAAHLFARKDCLNKI